MHPDSFEFPSHREVTSDGHKGNRVDGINFFHIDAVDKMAASMPFVVRNPYASSRDKGKTTLTSHRSLNDGGSLTKAVEKAVTSFPSAVECCRNNDEESDAASMDVPRQRVDALIENEKTIPKDGAMSATGFISTSVAMATKSTDNASSTASALVIAAAEKAGMQNVDKERIARIILRESGNSLYIQQQRRRDEKVNDRIRRLQEKLSLQHNQKDAILQACQNQVDQSIPQWLQARPLRSTKVVVDMDMFFMACELLNRPDLVDKPCCVGGSLITTSNYVARKYGVRSAMAGYIGDALVRELSNHTQELIHVKSNFELYREKSRLVRDVLAEYDPHLSCYSLDEAYMDIGPYLVLQLAHPEWTHDEIRKKLHGESSKDEVTTESSSVLLLQYPSQVCLDQASRILHVMRDKVRQATGGLTCSAGLAPNFMIAKIASDCHKPNGQCIVDGSAQDRITDFLYPLPCRKVSGIGRVTDKILQAFGIATVGDLYQQRGLVQFLFQPATANFLQHAAVGCSTGTDQEGGGSKDDVEGSNNENAAGQKGISRERTFGTIDSWTVLHNKLEDVANLLSQDMQGKNLQAHTVTVKVKLKTYDCLSKARSLERGVYVQQAEDLRKIATDLLQTIRDEHRGPFAVRLLGIRCSNFLDENSSDASQKKLDEFLASGAAPTKYDPPPTLRSRSPTARKRGRSKTPPLPPTSPPSVEANDGPPLNATCTVPCPVCRMELDAQQNDELNRHIDACLNGQMVRAAIRESFQDDGRPSSNTSKRRRAAADFFRPASR